MAVLSFNNLGLSFGDFDLFVGLTGEIPHGAKIGLVGPNGIGKTTLLRLLVGQEPPSAGVVQIAKGTRIGYLQQEAAAAFQTLERTVYEELLTVFADLRAQEAALHALEEELAQGEVTEELLERYGAAQEAFEQAGGYEYELRIRQTLTGLGFPPDQHDLLLAHCSGGQQTRVLLGRLLLEKPDLLVLDEPTNHLDVEAVEWLEETLTRWGGALLIVSHDRYFLDRVVTVIWELSRVGLELYRGNYTTYVQQRELRWAYREEEFETVRARFLKDLDYVKRNYIRASSHDRAEGILRRLVRCVKAVEAGGAGMMSLQWSDVTAQVSISGDKWGLAEVERRIKGLRAPSPRQHQIKMRLGIQQRGGDLVLRTYGLRIGYPGTPLFTADDLLLKRGARAVLIGANGAGKSTFLKTLMGELEPVGGELVLGANLTLSYFSQVYTMLDPTHSVLEEFQAWYDIPAAEARDHLARYLFRGDDVFKPMEALSGGERGRFALAVLALQRANFLLLDEPTNHLDIPAQEALEEALRHFPGTVLLVSHDRYLVSALATEIWELRDGRLRVYAGGYAAYLAARAQEQEARQERPRPAPVVRARPRPDRGQALALAEAEARIGELELSLQQLNEALLTATAERAWERLHTLNQEYQQTQARLESLMEQWEALA